VYTPPRTSQEDRIEAQVALEPQPDDSDNEPSFVVHWKHVSTAGPRSVVKQAPVLDPKLHEIAVADAMSRVKRAICEQYIGKHGAHSCSSAPF